MKALVTGVTGQDGSYLAEYLVLRGFNVYGLVRRSASPNMWRVAHLLDNPNFTVVNGDLTDLSSMLKLLEEIKPDRIYNLGAQSYVGISWDQPYHTLMATGLGAVNIFEAVKLLGFETRIFQASSSEMFGKYDMKKTTIYQDDPMYARSPYGAAKILAHQMARLYRDQGLYISCGISFNHESPRRGLEFVTRKITWQGTRVALGKQKELELGNMDSMRDWGYAPDFVYGFYLTLEQPTGRDYMFATGEAHSVREFLKGVKEHLYNLERHELRDLLFKSSESNMRPADVNWLCGDYTLAKTNLKWQPRVLFRELVQRMTDDDLNREKADEISDAFIMKEYIGDKSSI